MSLHLFVSHRVPAWGTSWPSGLTSWACPPMSRRCLPKRRGRDWQALGHTFHWYSLQAEIVTTEDSWLWMLLNSWTVLIFLMLLMKLGCFKTILRYFFVFPIHFHRLLTSRRSLLPWRWEVGSDTALFGCSSRDLLSFPRWKGKLFCELEDFRIRLV